MDAMAPRRGSDSSGAAERVVNQLLAEMDGADERSAVYLVAATNRPDMIDPALLRPGRLDKLLFIPLPDPSAREAILVTLLRNVPCAAEVDAVFVTGLAGTGQLLEEAAAEGEVQGKEHPRRMAPTEGFSGADLAALVSGCLRLRRSAAKNLVATHFA